MELLSHGPVEEYIQPVRRMIEEEHNSRIQESVLALEKSRVRTRHKQYFVWEFLQRVLISTALFISVIGVAVVLDRTAHFLLLDKFHLGEGTIFIVGALMKVLLGINFLLFVTNLVRDFVRLMYRTRL